MPKNVEVKKLNPGDCLRSLQEFHERVVMLVSLVQNFADEIPSLHVRTQFINSANKVKEFYHESD